MFLYRFFIGPIAACIIAAIMVASWSKADTGMLWFMGVFVVLMLLCSIMALRHVRGLRVALEQEPQPCTIEIKSHTGGKTPSTSYIAVMSVAGDVWRATLAGNAFERANVGGPYPGQVWQHPVSGVPHAAALGETKLAIIPSVTKVEPGSMMEDLIQRVYGQAAEPT